MKKVARRLIRKMGYDLKPIPKVAKKNIPIPAREKQAVQKILQEFSNQKGSDSPFHYQALREYLSDERLQFFFQLLKVCADQQLDLSQKKIADIGSGTGYLLRLIEQQQANPLLFGFDTFEEILALAAYIAPRAQHLPKSLYAIEDQFDVIFCTEVLEHLVEPKKALLAMQSLLNPSGALVLSVPDGRVDQQASGDMREDGSSYWGHIHFWSPESWPLLMQEHFPRAREIQVGKVDAWKLYAIIKF
ncbi:MAG: class I SAM-dependent methyltransferase [Bacteroidota bacterium]